MDEDCEGEWCSEGRRRGVITSGGAAEATSERTLGPAAAAAAMFGEWRGVWLAPPSGALQIIPRLGRSSFTFLTCSLWEYDRV